jgi:hypothetical protein
MPRSDENSGKQGSSSFRASLRRNMILKACLLHPQINNDGVEDLSGGESGDIEAEVPEGMRMKNQQWRL